MKKFYFPVAAAVLLALLFVSCNNTVDSVSNPVYDRIYFSVDSIRTALQSSLNKTVPSLNVLITTPSAEYFVSSAPSPSTQVTKDTYFRFASNTKNFTSASVLNMQEDGWLNIESRITDTIPGSTVAFVPASAEWNIPNKNQITIKELLQHSAGVFDISNDSIAGYPNGYVMDVMLADPNHQFTSSELVGMVASRSLSYFPPGTNHHYSNTGYTILSEIISRVYSFHAGSQKLYSDYIYDYITGSSAPVPLNVHFPYLASDNQLPFPGTPGKVHFEDGSVTNTSVYNKSANVGEGNGYGTMSMLRTYIRSMITGGNVLNAASLNLMKNEVSPGSPNYALGCTLFTNLGYGHTGATMGYFSCMFYDTQTGVSVVGMIPFWDLTNGGANYYKPFYAMLDACWAARAALGYAGKP